MVEKKETKGPQQKALEVEFPAAMIRRVDKGGAKLDYVPVAEVIVRLNEVLSTSGWTWNLRQVWRDTLDPDWFCAIGDLTLTVDGVTSSKSGTGGVKVKRTTSTKQPVDLGDEAKGADSDALKKAAQRFGVALDMARKEEAIAYEAPVPARDPTAEGWESAERAQQYVSALSDRIKNLDEKSRKLCKEETDRLGIVWPPTKDEWERLHAFIESLESQEDDATKETVAAVEKVFEGATDITPEPASPQKVQTARDYLAKFKQMNELGAVKAMTKYLKTKQWSLELSELTEEQIDEILDFMESL